MMVTTRRDVTKIVWGRTRESRRIRKTKKVVKTVGCEQTCCNFDIRHVDHDNCSGPDPLTFKLLSNGLLGKDAIQLRPTPALRGKTTQNFPRPDIFNCLPCSIAPVFLVASRFGREMALLLSVIDIRTARA